MFYGMMSHVFRYLQRLSEELLHNLRLSNKAGSQALEAGVRRELANTNITQLQPQHAELVRRTRELQAQVRTCHVYVPHACTCSHR